MTGNVFEIKHPLVQHKLSLMRDKNATTMEFRRLAQEIGLLLAYEATRNVATVKCEIETPMEKMQATKLAGKKTCIISILRAGNGLLEGVLQLLPAAKVGFLGMERNETTHVPQDYYCKLPNALESRGILLIDPMLATGFSAIESIHKIKAQGGKDIKFLSLVAAPKGIEAMQKHHPDVAIYTAAIDRELNENAYILPGLGDAGDRIYGTL